MIRQVDEIPATSKTASRREMLKADVEEAWEKKIKAFEFEGYDDAKYLPTNAREAAESVIDKIIQKAYNEEYRKIVGEKEKWFHRPINFRLVRDVVSIVSRKIEGKRHVYCMFHHMDDFDKFIHETVVKDIANREEKNRRIEEMKKKKAEAMA